MQSRTKFWPVNYGPRRKKTCLRGFANNTGADQPAHPHRLISAFVIRFLESIICKLATSEISNFYRVSVAEETGLKLALSNLSETPKTGFVTSRPIYSGPITIVNIPWAVAAVRSRVVYLLFCQFIVCSCSCADAEGGRGAEVWTPLQKSLKYSFLRIP